MKSLKSHVLATDKARLKQDWIETILYHEEIILAEICYDLDISDPYVYLTQLLKSLGCNSVSKKQAWAILTDSFNGDACLRFRARDLAAGAIFTQFKRNSLDLPQRFWEITETTEPAMADFYSRFCALMEFIET
ncbi:hypothetical protein HDU91_003753 [Kappamyces sp. JEL0680]|nr:hypothetical protein HDU91_003753 [Kappamyces sp. JEL0680]